MILKLIITLLSLTWLLNACSNPKEVVSESASNCPSSPSSYPKFQVKDEGSFFTQLKTLNIITSDNTITFQSQDYDFIFCDDNQSFITKAGTYRAKQNTPKNYDEAIKELSDPPYQSIDWQKQKYQYRVLLDPNPFPDFKVEPKQVILELIKPEAEQPQRYTLYTLKQVKEKQTGIQLGIPEITVTVVDNNQFYWAVSPEQGEGNGGIATIVNYNPEVDKINIIQPQKLLDQQINDLAISKNSTETMIWLATQTSGEGNPYLPGMGLVSYNSKTKLVKAYHARNSHLVGIIPHKLEVKKEQLWVATGNGICQIKWQTIEQSESWHCWQFSLKADIPLEGLDVYSSLLNTTAKTTINPDEITKTFDILWWSPQDYEIGKGRYEIVYNPGFSVILEDNGAVSWAELYHNKYTPYSWEAVVYWPGKDWVWKGNKFIRPFDGVPLNYFGGGPGGISTWKMPEKQRSEIYTMRGDLDLIKLTKTSTNVKYYSGWVDDSLLQPYITIIPAKKTQNAKPNPLKNF